MMKIDYETLTLGILVGFSMGIAVADIVSILKRRRNHVKQETKISQKETVQKVQS